MITYSNTDHFVLLPGLLLALFGCAVLLLDFLFPKDVKGRGWLVGIALAGVGFAGWQLWRQYLHLAAHDMTPLSGFNGALVADGFSVFFNGIVLVSAALVMLISYRYLEDEKEHNAEYYALVLFAACGAFFLNGGLDMVTIFIGLELMALSFYVLVGFLRADKRSNEAAMKYLLLGGFSTGFLIYGFSIFYGLTGSTNLTALATVAQTRGAYDPLLYLGVVTVLIGLLFKIGAAPFHMWAPDTYEGAPTTVTAFLAVASKTASFALLLRVLIVGLGGARSMWEPLITVAAVLSLTVGNLAALSQSNVKRLLAYSSVAHAGYVLLGLVAGNQTGLVGVSIYLLTYAFMTIGAFLVLVALRRRGVAVETIEDLASLGQRFPYYGLLMLVFLMSLAGLPPTAGFIGKYYIFLALVESGKYGLAILGALYVAVSLYYYFRLVRSMFLSESNDTQVLAKSNGVRFALAITGVATLAMGILPEPFLRMAAISLGR